LLVFDKAEIEFSFARSSGAGGQNVNKVNSKAILRWRIHESRSVSRDIQIRFFHKFKNKITKDGDLVLTCENFRDQGRNVSECINKLNEMILSVSQPEKTRVKTKPSRSRIKKRLNEKKIKSEKKSQRRRVNSHHDP
jgi:ribosome-associated protein